MFSGDNEELIHHELDMCQPSKVIIFTEIRQTLEDNLMRRFPLYIYIYNYYSSIRTSTLLYLSSDSGIIKPLPISLGFDLNNDFMEGK